MAEALRREVPVEISLALLDGIDSTPPAIARARPSSVPR
jgi:hypothetical protein